ncbi:unnamed protein product [Closterium sp. NIES-64]|nr:unnamed protein product [Closterium sp. NIES-64]
MDLTGFIWITWGAWARLDWMDGRGVGMTVLQFLQFMCPRYKPSNVTPIPDGSDPSACPRSILGVYDDRDFGWAHGYKRLMHKDPLKTVFLDALGAPKEDPRRDRGDGIQAVYHLNEALPGQQIDVFLLDERYYRENLPCHVRREFCTSVMDLDRPHSWRSWCGDFLGREVPRNRWSCCDKDEKLFQAWCGHEAHRNHSLWEEACSPAHDAFGSQKISVRKKGKDPALWDIYIEEQPEPHNSQYCEVLGRQQRLWLQDELHDSNAPIKVIVSPSPLFTNPLPQPCSPFPKELSTAATLTGPYGSEPPDEPDFAGSAAAAAAAPSGANGSVSEPPSTSVPPVAPVTEDPVTNVTQCTCSGDDWECYKPAQLHFLEMLSRVEKGCVVLLTGDMGYSDIKVFRPGPGRAYTDLYRSSQHYRPIYQVMASGLTRRPRIDTSCSPGNAWTHDPLKMRHPSECSIAPAPSFGMVEVDWDREKLVKLQVRDGDTTGYASAVYPPTWLPNTPAGSGGIFRREYGSRELDVRGRRGLAAAAEAAPAADADEVARMAETSAERTPEAAAAGGGAQTRAEGGGRKGGGKGGGSGWWEAEERRRQKRVPAWVFGEFEHPIRRGGLPLHAWIAFKVLKDAGLEPYLVGGAVRDLFLGRIPKDVDIIVDASPAHVARVFRERKFRPVVIGRRFPICRVFLKNSVVDISSFDSEPTVVIPPAVPSKDDALLAAPAAQPPSAPEAEQLAAAATVAGEDGSTDGSTTGAAADGAQEAGGLGESERWEEVDLVKVVSVETDGWADEKEDEEGEEEGGERAEGGGAEAVQEGLGEEAGDVAAALAADAGTAGAAAAAGIDGAAADSRATTARAAAADEGTKAGGAAAAEAEALCQKELDGVQVDWRSVAVRPAVQRHAYVWSEGDERRWRNAMKRDLTVNALFFDPHRHMLFDYVGGTHALLFFDPHRHMLFDYVGGTRDLYKQTVRVIGDTRASFQEDPARCVRAIRLAARLGFRLSTGVTRALKAPSTLPTVATLPQSRMQMELVQMMSHGASEPSVRMLWQFNLLPLLLPLQAQYLRAKKFSQKAMTDRPDLMFDLLHELDALVQPDNPCHPSTWLSLLALHLAASDLPNHLRPLALLTAVLAAHPSCPSARIAARVAISFAQSSHPNLCQRLGIQGPAWPSEEKPSLTGEGRREKESRFGPKQQEGQVGEICSDGSIGGGEYVGGGQWATEGSKGMEEEDWEGFREVEWRGEEGMEGMGRGEVARAVRGAVGALKARREAVLQELAAVEGQLGEVVSEMMLRGGGIGRFAARLEEVGEGGGEGKWEGDGEKGETQERKQAIESSGLLLSGEGGKGEAEGGGGAAAQVLTPDLASAVAESLARVRAWGQQWHEEQQMLTDVSRLLVALEGTGGMGAMGAVRTTWGRGGGGGVGVEGREGHEGKAGEGRGGDDVVAGAEEGSGGDGVSDGGECDSSEGEEGAVSAAADAAGDDAHGSGSQRAARRKKNAWRLTTEEDIIRAASLVAVRASQQVHHMVDDRLLSATLHDLTGLERHDNKSKPVRGSCETGGAVRADVPKSTFDPSMEIDLQQPLAAGGSAGSADVVRLVAAEHQRILNAFRTALESPLPPSQLALPTLAEALQLGGSAGSGGGIGSAATGTTLPKEGKLTAEQNQLLEIGLRSLLQSLVESAAAQGVSVLSYSPTGPPGVPGSSAAVIRLLDVVLHLCEAGRMEGGVVFQLLEDLMDQSPIADCHLVFSYIESKQHVLAKEHILQRGKLVLLRACNQLVRRLSKANDLVFCGRVLMFLAYFFPIAEKSAVNIKGAFNTSNKTDYAREAPQDAGPLLDFKFYTTFWSLQEYFSNPAVALPKWAVFSSHLCTVLDTFEAQPLGTDVDAGAEAGTGAGDEAGAGAGEEGGAEGAGLGAGGAREGGERGAGGAGGVGEAVGEMLGAYSMKYLTSTSLLQLELRDGSFRRQFLVQCLILLEYLMIPGKAEKDDKREAMRAEAREFEARVKKLLRRLPPGGEDFLTSVEHVMRREKHWVAWKKEVCPPFDRPPADLTPRRDPTPKRPRYLMGNKELDRLFRWADKHPDALTDPEQVAVPAFRDFIQPLADDMDPENCIEAEYHRTNDKVFCWRALRLAARSDIEAFNRFGDLGMEGVVPPDMLPDEVRVKLHKGKPKKDSHGDRDAVKDAGKGAANKEAVGDAGKDAAADGSPAAAAGAGARSTPGSAGGGGSGRKGRGGEVSAMEVEGERKADGEGEGRASASKKRSRIDE